MSAVIIRWDIRAAGREVGDIETVELTEFVAALIYQGRVTVLDEEPKDEQLELPFETEVEAAVAKPSKTRAKFVTAELDAKLAEAEGYVDGDVQA